MLMPGSLFLDTNIVIALLKQEQTVLTKLAESQSVWISPVVLGELYFGALKSSQVTNNLIQIQTLESRLPLLHFTAKTSACYGEIKAQLKAKGKPIPENDIWIAASALEHRVTLITRDKHLQYIDLIQTEAW